MKVIQNKMPLFQSKKIVASLFNKKISSRNKVMAVAIIVYIISPLDFIPDFIPLVGYADDVILPILLLITNKLLTENNESNKSQDIKQAEKVWLSILFENIDRHSINGIERLKDWGFPQSLFFYSSV